MRVFLLIMKDSISKIQLSKGFLIGSPNFFSNVFKELPINVSLRILEVIFQFFISIILLFPNTSYFYTIVFSVKILPTIIITK